MRGRAAAPRPAAMNTSRSARPPAPPVRTRGRAGVTSRSWSPTAGPAVRCPPRRRVSGLERRSTRATTDAIRSRRRATRALRPFHAVDAEMVCGRDRTPQPPPAHPKAYPNAKARHACALENVRNRSTRGASTSIAGRASGRVAKSRPYASFQANHLRRADKRTRRTPRPPLVTSCPSDCRDSPGTTAAWAPAGAGSVRASAVASSKVPRPSR